MDCFEAAMTAPLPPPSKKNSAEDSVPRRRNFPPTTAFQESRMGVVGAIVDRMEQYRRLAAQCVHMAAGTADLQFKAILIGMAGAWLKLADLAEKNSRAEGARNLIPSACDTPAAKSGQ